MSVLTSTACYLDLICDTLEDAGIDAVPGEHGPKAYACIKQERPPVVILDIQMPVVDGIQVFERMRADPATAAIPVVFFTANPHILRQRLPNYTTMNAQFLPKPCRCYPQQLEHVLVTLAWIIHETGQLLCAVQKLVGQLAIFGLNGRETRSRRALQALMNNPG